MKEIIKRNWKKVVSFVLAVAMVAAYLPTDMTEVKAENTSVSFSLASAAPQEAEGRYLITLNVSGVSIPNYSTGWENMAYLDGVEKTGTGDTSGFAYVYVNESQMYILLKYDYVQSGANASSAIGSHQFIIPEGTVIPFGGVTMELSKDFVLDINGSTVTESTTSLGTLTYQSGTAGNHDGADDCCYINMSISGVSNTRNGWYGTNTIEVDGTRVSSSNIYYVASNGTDVTLRIRYSAIKEALGVDSLTGSHTVAIPRYVLVPNAGGDQGDTFINKEKVSFQVDFDNNTVTPLIGADVTHNMYYHQRSAIEDNVAANSWFRFTSAASDTLTTWTEWSIVDGGFRLNGEIVSSDLVEFIKISDTIYHVGLDALLNSGVTIASKDYITLSAMVQDTTDAGYYVRFETIYFQYDTNGDGYWTVLTEEPELTPPTPAVTHIYSSVTSTQKGGNGNFLRFAVADTMAAQSKALVILEGGLYKNGTILGEDTYDIQKPWADAYHIGLDKGKLTFDVGDRLKMDVLVVGANDTTYSYPIKFEITFECISSSAPDSVTSTWGWSVIAEPTEIPVIATVDILNDETRNSAGNCTDGFYFMVDTDMDQSPDDDGLPFDTQNWTIRYSALDGGIYVGEELQSNIKIIKVTESLYYVPLKDNQPYDVTPIEGMQVKIDGKFGSETQAVQFNAATFKYLGDGKWALGGSVETEELSQEAITIYDLYDLTGVSEIQITPDAFFNLTDLKKSTNVGLKLHIPKTNYTKDTDELAFGFSKATANSLWVESGYQVKINPQMGRVLILEDIDTVVAQTFIEDVKEAFDLEFGVVNMVNQEGEVRARKIYVKVNDVEVLSWMDENLERQLGTYVPAFASAGHDVMVQSITHKGYELVNKTPIVQDISELNGGLAYSESKATQCVLIGEAKASTNIALRTKVKLDETFAVGDELKLAFSKTSTDNIWEAEESGWFVFLRQGQVLIGSDMDTIHTIVGYEFPEEFLLEVGTYDIEVQKEGKKIEDYGRMVYVKIDGVEVATWLDTNMDRTLGKNAIVYTSQDVSARLQSLTSTKYLTRKGNTVYDLFDALGLSEVTLNKNSITKLGSLEDTTQVAFRTKVTFNKESEEFKLALSKTTPDLYWDIEASGWQFWFRPISNQIFIGYGVDSYGAVVGYDFQGMETDHFVLEIGERDVLYNTGEQYGREIYIKIDGEEVLSWVDKDYSRKLGTYATAWASQNSNIKFESLTTTGYVPVDGKATVKDIFDVSEYASVTLVKNDCINIGTMETVKNAAVKMNVAFNKDADEFKIAMGKVSDTTIWDAEASGYQFWFRPASNQIFIGYGVSEYAEMIGYDFHALEGNRFVLEIGTRNVKFKNGKQYGTRVYMKINDEEICSWVDQDTTRVFGDNLIAYASANADVTISTLYQTKSLPIVYRVNGEESDACDLVRANAIVVLGKDSRINVQMVKSPMLSVDFKGVFQNTKELECVDEQRDVLTYIVQKPQSGDKIVIELDTKQLTVDEADIFDFYHISGEEAITMEALKDGYIGHVIKENGPGGINTAMRCILDTPEGPYNQIRIGYLGDNSGLWSTSGFIAQITNQKAAVQSSAKQTTLAEGSYELFQSGRSIVLEIGAVKCYEEGLYKYDRWYIKAGTSVDELELVTWFDSTKRGGYGSNVMSYGTDIEGSDFTLRTLLDIKDITDVSAETERAKLAVYDKLGETSYAVYYPETVIAKDGASIKLYTQEGMKLNTLAIGGSDVTATVTEDGGYVYEIASVENDINFAYTITEDSNMYAITGKGDGNIEVIVKEASVVAAGSATILVKANKGYIPSMITVNGRDYTDRFIYDESAGGWVYTLSGIREDKLIEAHGEEKQYQVQVVGGEHADVTLGGDVKDNVIPAGGVLELAIEPNKGWLICSTTVNGVAVPTDEGRLRISSVYAEGDVVKVEIVLKEGTVATVSAVAATLPMAAVGVLSVVLIVGAGFFLRGKKKGVKNVEKETL